MGVIRPGSVPAPSGSRIRVLVTDYGGVLTNPLAESYAALAVELGITVGELIAARSAAGARLGADPMALLEVGALTEAGFVDAVAGHLPPGARARLGTDGFGPVWFRNRRPNQEMLDLLATVRSAGHRIALLTNNVREWGPLWRATLPTELFELVVNSAEEGVRKPDPAIYRRTVDRLGVTPAECLFLDDVAENCATAEAFGMTAIRFVDTAQAVADVLGALGPAPALRLLERAS